MTNVIVSLILWWLKHSSYKVNNSNHIKVKDVVNVSVIRIHFCGWHLKYIRLGKACITTGARMVSWTTSMLILAWYDENQWYNINTDKTLGTNHTDDLLRTSITMLYTHFTTIKTWVDICTEPWRNPLQYHPSWSLCWNSIKLQTYNRKYVYLNPRLGLYTWSENFNLQEAIA